jgi:hypothetical protein
MQLVVLNHVCKGYSHVVTLPSPFALSPFVVVKMLTAVAVNVGVQQW